MNTPSYWTEDIKKEADNVKTLEELSALSLRILKTLPRPILLVCGPISTGGLGSIDANLMKLNETVYKAINSGESVFDQTPFEDAVKRLRKEFNDTDGTKTLEAFYRPLLESGFISEMRFLPDWQSSKGATWEHKFAEDHGIKIVHL